MLVKINWLIVLATALVPLLVGFIWYNPSVFGKAWSKQTGIQMDGSGGNIGKIMAISLVYSLLLAISLPSVVIHQMSVQSALMGEPNLMDSGSEANQMLQQYMAKYGDRFRTFGHGFLHGSFMGLLMTLGIVGTSALYEKRSFKYVLITAGYWFLSLGIMGGIICAFA